MLLQEDFQKLVSNFRRIRFESTVCLCLVFFFFHFDACTFLQIAAMRFFSNYYYPWPEFCCYGLYDLAFKPLNALVYKEVNYIAQFHYFIVFIEFICTGQHHLLDNRIQQTYMIGVRTYIQFHFTFFSHWRCFHFRLGSLVILSGWSRFACDSFCNPYYCIWRPYYSYCWQSEWYAAISLLCKMVTVFF